MAKPPSCPQGYTWLPQLGATCVKITSVSGVVHSTNPGTTYYEVPMINKVCQRDGTRMATPVTLGEAEALYEWFDTVHKDEAFWLGFKMHFFDPTNIQFHEAGSSNVLNYDEGEMTYPESLTSASLQDACLYTHKKKTYASRCRVEKMGSPNFDIFGMCQYKECLTTQFGTCKFPFK